MKLGNWTDGLTVCIPVLVSSRTVVFGKSARLADHSQCLSIRGYVNISNSKRVRRNFFAAGSSST